MHEVRSNLQVEKMEDLLVLIIDLIDKLGYKIGQAHLLACLDYVIQKGFDTTFDLQHMKMELKQNV